MKIQKIAFIGLWFAMAAHAMDDDRINQLNVDPLITNARWDKLIEVMDQHPEIGFDEWVHFLIPRRETVLQNKDSAGQTLSARLLFHACHDAGADAARKALLEDRLARFRDTKMLYLTQDDLVKLDIGRNTKPHHALARRLRLIPRSMTERIGIGIGIGALISGCLAGIGYLGYRAWHDQKESNNLSPQQDIAATASAIALGDSAIV